MVKVFVYDEFSPEDIAMMQALYSRSGESVEVHAEKVKKTGSGKFMESYYVGYNHKSIGDCGTTTLFIEGCSLLAAKAIQDNELFRGQETSTRYIDMANQSVYLPDSLESSSEIKTVVNNWMDFYKKATPKLIDKIKLVYPRTNEKESVYNNAIKAKAFDIMRGFLPAGITTQFSWSTDLRQATDQIERLMVHPLDEVKNIANLMYEKLKEKYPSSFNLSNSGANLDYYRSYAFSYPNMIDEEKEYEDYEGDPDAYFDYDFNIDTKKLRKNHYDLLKGRHKFALLPKYLKKYGYINASFILDYGSFRDIQRHRGGLCTIPILDTSKGFNGWYLEQLREYDNELFLEAQTILQQNLKIANDCLFKGSVHREELQYVIPLGFNVLCSISYSLPQSVYVSEMRTAQTVHPTLRIIAKKLAKVLQHYIPYMGLYVDLSDSIFSIKRGNQTIEQKQ